MAKGRSKGPTAAEREVDELRALAGSRLGPDGLARVRAALGSPRSLVAARAAAIVKDQALDGFGKELAAAFERFLPDPVKRDPGCHAKLAAIEALDFTNHLDPEPFLAAARHIQMEPAWGPPVDTACALRARAIVALARLGHPDFVLVAGELFADKESPVRQAVAEALALAGDRAGAGLLLYKLRIGDADPLVPTACLVALLSLSPERGLAEARAHLGGRDEVGRELAALALGQSSREDALAVLLEELAATPLPRGRAVLWRALGIHRSERALEKLLEVVAEGAEADARAALEALAPRRFDPGLRERARRAARANDRVDLAAAFAELFRDE